MALSSDRNTLQRRGESLSLGVATDTICNGSGSVQPGTAAAGLIALGRFRYHADNSNGDNGAIEVEIERDVFEYLNSSAGDAITEENIGQMCYVVDDETVALTSNGGTRSIAGRIFDVDANGVWVDFRIADAPKKIYLCLTLADLKGADANAYYISTPVAGRITDIAVTLEAALAGADGSVTASIGGVAVTNGVVALVEAASAAGLVFDAQPTANNALAARGVIKLLVGGANTAIVAGVATIEITL